MSIDQEIQNIIQDQHLLKDKCIEIQKEDVIDIDEDQIRNDLFSKNGYDLDSYCLDSGSYEKSLIESIEAIEAIKGKTDMSIFGSSSDGMLFNNRYGSSSEGMIFNNKNRYRPTTYIPQPFLYEQSYVEQNNSGKNKPENRFNNFLRNSFTSIRSAIKKFFIAVFIKKD